MINIGDEPGEMGAALLSVELGECEVFAVGAGEHHTCVVVQTADSETRQLRYWGKTPLPHQLSREARVVAELAGYAMACAPRQFREWGMNTPVPPTINR